MGAAGKVQTATIHGAKGGEWKHVILVGCTDGSLPFFKAKTEAQLIEERNAIYVAATRVKEQLYMVHAPYTNARARKKFNELSRFLRPQQVERCSTRSKMA
jgi:DNA helicase-2/ATP-dependent DNA helicase PcrA